MTLRNGIEFLAMPGPTNVPEKVLAAMHRPAVDIYAGELLGVTASCLADLRTIFSTKGSTYVYAANGHGAWEAALSNVLSRGDKVLVLASGLFAPGWGEMARILGAEVEVIPGDWRRAVDPQAVEDRLRKDAKGEIKAVLMVQVDTASSVANDVAAVRQAIDAAGHDALYMVDTIASLATMPFEMDAWGVDVAVGGSQKGLMTPPGLGFNAASEKAHAAHRKADLVTRYWDWSFRDGEEHYMKYCGTPPEHLMFGLRAALDMILAEGLEAVLLRHRRLAEAVRSAVEAWSEGGVIGFNVRTAEHRANSVTTVLTQGHSPQKLIDFARDGCGITLGVSLGGPGHEAFRIAHMGHVNAAMVLATLGVVEAGLVAHGIPHGAGARAAIGSIAKAVAN